MITNNQFSFFKLSLWLGVIGFWVWLAVVAMAQDPPKPQANGNGQPAASAPDAKPESKQETKQAAAKPIIVERAKILEAENLSLKLANLRLQAEAAIPDEIKKQIKDAEKAIEAFYKDKIGVTREELTGYDISNGADGAIILKRKPTPPTLPTPTPKP